MFTWLRVSRIQCMQGCFFVPAFVHFVQESMAPNNRGPIPNIFQAKWDPSLIHWQDSSIAWSAYNSAVNDLCTLHPHCLEIPEGLSRRAYKFCHISIKTFKVSWVQGQFRHSSVTQFCWHHDDGERAEKESAAVPLLVPIIKLNNNIKGSTYTPKHQQSHLIYLCLTTSL